MLCYISYIYLGTQFLVMLGTVWVQTILDEDSLKNHADWRPDFDNLCNVSLLFSPKMINYSSHNIYILYIYDFIIIKILPNHNSSCKQNKNSVRLGEWAACNFHLIWDVQSAGTDLRIESNIEYKTSLLHIKKSSNHKYGFQNDALSVGGQNLIGSEHWLDSTTL